MLFVSSTLTGLIAWCQAFKHGLSAGLSLQRVFELQSKKGPAALRDTAGAIATRLGGGESLADALEVEGQSLPPLFRQMTAIGEKTGHLPEIFGEMGDYYELQRTLGRDFRAQIAWPVFQFVVAVGVIALLMYILGVIGTARGGEPIAPIGFGLTGSSGAITFLLVVGIGITAMGVSYRVLTRRARQRVAFEAFLLRLPMIGACARSFALGRFSLALRLTLETGMPTADALRQSLRASGNAAFIVHEDRVVRRIKKGDDIHKAVRMCPAIPGEFIEILAVAEVSGQIPEVMARQARHYRDEASRQLKNLARFAGYGVWFMVAVMIIWAIYRIANIYFGMIGQL